MKKIFIILVLNLFFCNTIVSANPICEKGDCINGEGILTYKNPYLKYEGNFKEGKIHGYGVITGTKYIYEGNHINSRKNGFGKIEFNSGLSYEGEWKDNKHDGNGTLILPSGHVFKGKFKNGGYVVDVAKVNPDSNSIIIPVTIHLLEVNYKNLVSNNPNKNIEEVERHLNYANYLWKDAGFYFKLTKIQNSKSKIPKNFDKMVKWRKTKYKQNVTDGNKWRDYVAKVIKHKKNKVDKTINIYFFPSGMFPGCGTAAHRAKGNFNKTFIFLPYSSNMCSLQSFSLAHELGHTIGVSHMGGKNDLMSGEYVGGTNISLKVIDQAKLEYETYLKKNLE
jgi:hypothetical protein